MPRTSIFAQGERVYIADEAAQGTVLSDFGFGPASRMVWDYGVLVLLDSGDEVQAAHSQLKRL